MARRHCSAESLYAFRAACNSFHRIVHAAKSQYWSSWLHRVEHTQSACPRAGARMVRRRFRSNSCRIAPLLSPDKMTHPSQQSECMRQWREHFVMLHLCILTPLMFGIFVVSTGGSIVFVQHGVHNTLLTLPLMTVALCPSIWLNSGLLCNTARWTKHRVAIRSHTEHYVSTFRGGNMPFSTFLNYAGCMVV